MDGGVALSRTPDLAVVAATLRAAGCVFAEDEAAVLVGAASTPTELDVMVADRVAGSPLELIVGWAEFCGLRIAVEPGVFVPRRRTEFLAELAAGLTRPDAVVIDLCCGSGAVGAAIVARCPGITLCATDIDPAAVACARINLAGDGDVYHGDLFAPLPPQLRGAVDVVAANVPYVPTDAMTTMPAEARKHEPRAALDGGADGLDIVRRLVGAAPEWLAAGGNLLFEVAQMQVPAAITAVTAAGMAARVERDENRCATVIVGAQPPIIARHWSSERGRKT